MDGVQAWCVRPQSLPPHPVSQGLLPYLFEDIAGVSYHAEATLASTGELLERACREEQGLHLALISMDTASSETTRELADDALEEYLEHPHVLEFIENRLYSKCLPESALWTSSRTSGDFQAYPKVSSLKRSVVGTQAAIRRVRAAWDALPVDLFADPENRAGFESMLVETGAFRTLANAAAEMAKPYSKGEAQLRLLSDRRYQTFTNFRRVLVEWTKTIPSSSQESAQPTRGERDYEPPAAYVRDERQKVSPYDAFQNVVLQKDAILAQLRKRNFQQVERFVDELVQLQVSNQKPDLAAKSLCDLAKGAKELGFLVYQLEWARRAKEIYPEDPWVHRQFADALLGQGEFHKALEAYEATVVDFPADVVARSGKAEVLKALGRLPEALEAYEATVRDFPADVVARTGKATLLVLLKRYEEAEALVRMDHTQTRSEWIGLHIRATIKLKQGRFDEADELFSAGTACPWVEVRSRFIGARAVLRIKTRQLKEAEAMIRSERSLVSKVIQIDIYRRMKRVAEAQPVLRELRGCGIAKIVEISRDLEQNMKPGKRTVSDDEFVEREIELLLAA